MSVLLHHSSDTHLLVETMSFFKYKGHIDGPWQINQGGVSEHDDDKDKCLFHLSSTETVW